MLLVKITLCLTRQYLTKNGDALGTPWREYS